MRDAIKNILCIAQGIRQLIIMLLRVVEFFTALQNFAGRILFLAVEGLKFSKTTQIHFSNI